MQKRLLSLELKHLMVLYLIELMKEIEVPRQQNSIKYSIKETLYTVIMKMCKITSLLLLYT